MKKHILVTATVAGLALVGCRSTERTVGMRGSQLEDLPQAAQASVKQEIGEGQVVDIDKERRSGRLVYEVTFQPQPGMEEKLHVTEDGRLLNSKQASMAGWVLREPAAADRSSSSSTTKSASAEIKASNDESQKYGASASTDTQFRTGANTSTATADSSYRSSSSLDNKSTSVSASSSRQTPQHQSRSTDLSKDHTPSSSASISTESETSVSVSTASTSGPLVGTKFQDLPQAVKDAVQEQYSSADIADIDKETRNGQVVYQISFKESGRNPKIYVAEDGAMLSESEFRESAGAATAEHLEAPKSGRGAAEALLSKEDTRPYFQNGELKESVDAELQSDEAQSSAEIEAAGADKRLQAEASATTQLKTSDLPEAVQKAIEDRAGSAKVMSIDKKTKKGKTVYEVKFQDSDKNPKLCIAEDGKVMDHEDKDR